MLAVECKIHDAIEALARVGELECLLQVIIGHYPGERFADREEVGAVFAEVRRDGPRLQVRTESLAVVFGHINTGVPFFGQQFGQPQRHLDLRGWLVGRKVGTIYRKAAVKMSHRQTFVLANRLPSTTLLGLRVWTSSRGAPALRNRCLSGRALAPPPPTKERH